MSIKTQCIIVGVISLIATTTVGFILFQNSSTVGKEIEKNRIISAIQSDIFERSIFRDDYFLHRTERSIIQLQVISKDLDQLYVQASSVFTLADEHASIDILVNNKKFNDQTFSKILTHLSPELEQQLVNQILIKSQDNITIASKLAETSRNNVAESQQKTVFFILMFIVGISIITMVTLYFIWRSIGEPLTALKEAAVRIASLDFSTTTTTTTTTTSDSSEFGELSRAFNQMAAKLKESFISLKSANMATENVLEDLTIEKKKEENLHKEIDRAKDEFISLASHQMRTPLTTVSWYTEMLLDGDAGKLNTKQKEYFQSIYAASQQMNDIIKSFLHILRLETGRIANKPIPTNLQDVTASILQESKLDIEKKHLKVTEHCEESLPLSKVDPELTRVILQNLISNAIKYTFEGKEITISLKGVTKGSVIDEKTVTQDSILVSVHGTDFGISASDHDKIFTKFFRTETAKKSDPNGSGLGLYMTKKMMDIIGGTIWFDSEEEKGTTFYALFPMDEKKLI